MGRVRAASGQPRRGTRGRSGSRMHPQRCNGSDGPSPGCMLLLLSCSSLLAPSCSCLSVLPLPSPCRPTTPPSTQFM